MNLPKDISKKIEQLFNEEDWEQAKSLVLNATIHDDEKAGARLQRCVVIASSGTMKGLNHYIDLLKIDYRNVIVAGEYEFKHGGEVQVRDLNRKFKV